MGESEIRDENVTLSKENNAQSSMIAPLSWSASKPLWGWGRYPRVNVKSTHLTSERDAQSAWEEILHTPERGLGIGLGRSYGDSGIPTPNGSALHFRSMDRVLDFDRESGWVTCEAGVSIYHLIQEFLPQGFFPPVVPGTQFVTVAGALCNDIHGKNHHHDGTFADHVREVRILTAQGEIVSCDASQHQELFWATAGGLGLTGLILSLKLKLTPVGGAGIEMESIRVKNLDHFFEVSAESKGFTHTVSWIDCVAQGAQLGRGIFMRGRHSEQQPKPRLLGRMAAAVSPLLNVPFSMPNFMLNPLSIRAFNEVYFRKHPARLLTQTVGYEPFFFPLDFVRNWNRIYGRRGFLQYQLVLPHEPDHRGIRKVLDEITQTGMGSFLAVIKEFGEQRHGGLSFPRPGVTLALDFPNYGRSLFELFQRLDRVVMDAGGRVYLGKDARLPIEHFRVMYPEWEAWLEVRRRWDPDQRLRSGMSERLGLS